jgi:hypothetical protein
MIWQSSPRRSERSGALVNGGRISVSALIKSEKKTVP